MLIFLSMWSKIKKLFKTEPEIQKESIRFSDLSRWFDIKKKEKLQEKQKALQDSQSKIKAAIKQLKEDIENLQKAKLLNEQIPERAKHYADGNREALIKKTKQLIATVEFPEELIEFEEFELQFQKNLKYFIESTQRPVKILNEFYSKETGKIFATVGTIQKEINKNKPCILVLNQLNEIEQSLNSRTDNKEIKKEKESEKARKEEEYLALQGELSSLQNLCEELNESKKYKEYLDKKENLQLMNAKIKQVRQEFTHSFSVIETALKKYSHITFENTQIISKYLLDPIDTFVTDKNLRILKIIEGTKKAIENNSIELKDKKKQKIQQELENMTSTFFNTFTRAYGLMKKDEKDIIEQLMNSEIKQKIKETEEKIKQLKEKSSDKKIEIANLSKALERLDNQGTLENIEKLIKEIFAIELEINESNS